LPNDFWRQTWRENGLMAESYHNQINLNWEQTRFLATMLHNVNCQKKSQMLKPEQLFELPVDQARKKKKAEPKSTPKEMQAFLAKYNAMTNKKTFK
tara:strand:- start:10599 stop:10886 length:288 start_codon:yes stop_codon:yes gene_type:complete